MEIKKGSQSPSRLCTVAMPCVHTIGFRLVVRTPTPCILQNQISWSPAPLFNPPMCEPRGRNHVPRPHSPRSGDACPGSATRSCGHRNLAAMHVQWLQWLACSAMAAMACMIRKGLIYASETKLTCRFSGVLKTTAWMCHRLCG